jgi:hypothetical protein
MTGTGYTRSQERPSPGSAGTKGYPFTTYKATRAGSASKDWILKGLIARGETTAWVGAPGSLKSAILTLLAHAVASGRDWCGKRNKGACAVIYLALERADLVKRRLRAYADQDGGLDLPIAVVAQTISFMDEKVVNEIVATMDEVERQFGIKVGLIILDTLAKTIAAGAAMKTRREIRQGLRQHPARQRQAQCCLRTRLSSRQGREQGRAWVQCSEG